MKWEFGRFKIKFNKPDERSLMIHKETSFSILSGLVTQAPILFFTTWFMLDVLLIRDSFTVTSANIIIVTILSYIRVFYTRKYFSDRYK